ncbi:MAG: HAMP domain-containing sensor histidine kinase [Pseudomonadota bacterium]
MTPRANPRISRRLWRAFLLQLAIISATAIMGVYLAEFAIREILIVSALQKETDYFWARRNIEDDTDAPNTHTLIGYVFDVTKPETIPEEFTGLARGIHELDDAVGHRVVQVSEENGERLYLVFDADNVRELATYFGIAPLALMLIVLYCSAWFAYRLARRAVSPVVQLAREVRNLNVETDNRLALKTFQDSRSADDEARTLSRALNHLIDRVNSFLDRERTFTRETSHELRSPLTVIRIASDVLLKRDDLNQTTQSLVEKINRAAKDMEELTSALLLLARENETGLEQQQVSINDIVKVELANAKTLYQEKNLNIVFKQNYVLHLQASEKMLGLVFGNLIRNACAYTEQGGVTVTVGDKYVEIADSGIGIPAEKLQAVFEPYFRMDHSVESGHGIGLSLVKRLTDRFGWPISMNSERHVGTTVRVSFPLSFRASYNNTANPEADQANTDDRPHASAG